jgi:hypothetical protein
MRKILEICLHKQVWYPYLLFARRHGYSWTGSVEERTLRLILYLKVLTISATYFVADLMIMYLCTLLVLAPGY